MKPIHSLNSSLTLKILGDEKRQKILSILMKQPATLTQLGAILDVHPANIRHHLKKLENAGLVALQSQKIVRGFVEKYYQASAGAYHISLAILPHTAKEKLILAAGSHDIALEALSSVLAENEHAPDMFSLPVGSLDGLIALRQGLCQFAGCHLFDPASDEFNVPYLRYLFPDRPVRVISLAHRQQGLITQAGNPKGIRGLADLASGEVRFVNRNRGAGTRLWLDNALRAQGVEAAAIRGYAHEVNTHTALAQGILNGDADAGVGLAAAASKFGLDFLPLFEERFDLVLLDEHYEIGLLHPVLDILQTSKFRQTVNGIPGYSAQNMGQEIRM